LQFTISLCSSGERTPFGKKAKPKGQREVKRSNKDSALPSKIKEVVKEEQG
jgi:hypothetical protein